MDRAKQMAFGVWRVAFMLLVTYGFTLILMTSAVQQQVAAELARSNPDLDYSSAYMKVLQLDELNTANAQLEIDERRLATVSEQAARRAEEARTASDDAWRDFRSAAPMAKLLNACGPSQDSDPVSVWAWTRLCADDADLLARERARLEEAWGTTPTALQLYRASQASQREADRAAANLKVAQEALAAGRTKAQESTTLSDAFDEMTALSTSWLPGGAVFESFSPLLLQILLALSAGAFGALLLTLILSVYPKSEFRFTTGRGFEARVLLGGLISVCVYVVLSGGSAILGTAGSLGDAPANVMTFCAVGVLAGMFSDRVAFWLSDRADVFFSRSNDTTQPSLPSAPVPPQ